MDSYLPHVGYVQFPRRPDDLTAAVCPACFTARTFALCPTCGLDLANPAIADLDAASTDAAESLDRRLELIGRIRYETTLAAPAAAPPSSAPQPVAAAAAAPTTVAAPPRPAPAAPAAPARHLGVQVILLIVGVSLLAVGAIFFLVYAFITFGLVWRSVIIGAVTVAAFVAASLLRRRKLFATSEAISALAVVFVYLDAFAIRANNLFDAQNVDGVLYWGFALLIAAAGFAAWHRLSGLRLPNVVAFTSFAPGLALLVGGASTAWDDDVRVFAGLLALGAGGLVHPLARGKVVERSLSLTIAILGVILAGVTALFVQPQVDWAPLVTLGLVVLVTAAHVWVLVRLAVGTVFSMILASLGALVAAVSVLPVAVRLDDRMFLVAVPMVVAALVALVLELVARRTSSRVAVVAAWSAAAVAGVFVASVTIGALGRALVVAALGTERWSVGGGQPLDTEPSYVAAAGALAAVVGIAAAAWALSGVLRRRYLIVVAAALGVVVLAVPLLGQLWLAVLAWLVVGAIAVALLIVARRLSWGAGIRIALLCTGVSSLALAYSSSWASIDTWWFASVGTVALLVVARVATTLLAFRAGLLGVASVLALVAIGSEGWHVNERFQAGAGAGLESAHAVGFLAIVLVGVAFLLATTLSVVETRVLFWISFVTALVTAAVSVITNAATSAFGTALPLVLPEFATSVVLALLFTAVLVPWAATRRFAPERLAASLALAPAAAWLADSLVRMLALPDPAPWIAPITAALIVAAVSLVAKGSRVARDIGVGIIVVPVLILALASSADPAWLVLLLSGVAALVVATSRDGLFSSTSPRKHLGWVALALAFGGLTWAMVDRGVRDLEPYVLPLTGALLLIALLAWRAHRESIAPAFIALGALVVSLIPLGVVGADGPVTRTVIVTGVAALLLLAGTFLRGSIYLDVAAAAGAAGVLVAGFARPIALSLTGPSTDTSLDFWVAGSVCVVLLAAVAQAGREGVARKVAAQAVLAITLGLATLVEVSVLRDSSLGTVRALVVVAVLAGIHVVGMLLDRAPFTRVIAWISLGLALFATLAGSLAGALDPFEWGTVLLAVALLSVGAVMLRRRADAGSWPWLAPGLLVVLGPSLIATFSDQPIWRLVGIGVVCVAAILVGALAKLQAPLLIGTVVVLIHAIRTFAPQLVAVYQLTEWWVWAVVGGAIIIFVAVTFERRMRDLTSVGSRIAALR
ncbi:MAG: hypothetical protein KF761_11525 [Salinibacterium sp.]|nr:hypothetical protein [Salinibacterium sp.]